MKNRRFVTIIAAVIAVLTATLAPATYAQSGAWPTRPVRWIVPFTAGGTADVIARTVTQKLSERWGQPVVVENRPGGDTLIGAMEVVKAAPDGYTLFQAINSTLTLNPFIYSQLPYDPNKDFTPVGIIAIAPMIIFVNEANPSKTLAQLLEQARAAPGVINFGGTAIVTQIMAEQLAREAQVKFTWVPYKGGIDATRAVLSNEIQVGIDAIANNLPHINSGKMRALAVNSPTRLRSMPQVPTLEEAGIREQRVALWHAVLAPRGLPKPILDKLQADLKAVLALPDVVEKMQGLGVEPSWKDADDLLKAVKTESAVTEPLVRELGIKIQ